MVMTMLSERLVSIARGFEYAVLKHRRCAADKHAVDPPVFTVQVIMGGEQAAENPGMAANIVFDGNERSPASISRLGTKGNASGKVSHGGQRYLA